MSLTIRKSEHWDAEFSTKVFKATLYLKAGRWMSWIKREALHATSFATFQLNWLTSRQTLEQERLS